MINRFFSGASIANKVRLLPSVTNMICFNQQRFCGIEFNEEIQRDMILKRMSNICENMPRANMRNKSLHELTKLNRDLDLDSLDQIQFAFAIEEEFGIELAEDEYDKMETIGDAIK
eukprot:CAMPEP_0201571902 /NCGR_PEP_ID=MMETSP0190_2-20130828/14897_1 /ASSEMBLY_ACC=CAM_ASM_000263 /TAXON_ID=37353 /ORGANISM="Rosalina sp." /LENGTH=115 /DNA_ID=CAMNT_0047997065 /DNA_START=17 /DNA_END=361 /DNA_ORIENTATION=+